MRKIHLKYCREVIFVVVAMLCSIGSIYAQVEQTVSGVVKDVAGEPLIGGSVLEVGTSNGAITDLDGKYSITAPADGILVFSFVGMEKQEIPV